MTNTVTLRADQTESLRNLVLRLVTEWQPSTEVAIGMMRKELEDSVRITSGLVSEYPHLDYQKSLAISQAYLDFIDNSPVSFFE